MRITYRFIMPLFITLTLLLSISSVMAAEPPKILPPPESLPQEVLEKLKTGEQGMMRENVPQREGVSTLTEETMGQEGAASTGKATPSASISLNVSEMEINNVFKILADRGGLNIVASRDVQGRVTIFLKDVSIIEALDVICEVNHLGYEQQGNLIKVMTNSEYEQSYGRKAYDRRVFKGFEIKHARAESIMRVLNEIKSREGRMFVDERTNRLMVIDVPEALKTMEGIMPALDIPSITRVFELIYAEPKELEPKLRDVLTRDGKIQVDSLNKKIIITDLPENVEKAAELIKAYDDYPETEVLVINLNYADPDKVKEKMDNEITKDIGSIKVDKRNSQVIIRDIPQQVTKIREIITAMDEPTREVLIETKVVQVALSDQFKLGIDWEYLAKKAANLNIKANFGALANTDPVGRVSVGVLNADDYHAILDALKTTGETKLLSAPRITAINNEEAKILVGSNVPYTTEETIYPQGGGNPVTTKKVTYIDVGIKLYVTPKISRNGFVTMKIKPEASSVTRYVDNNIPVVETSNVESTVMVKDGSTVVIAGLVKEEKVNEIARIPYLGRIPVLGYLFKKTAKKTINSELVIFLTPRIISGE